MTEANPPSPPPPPDQDILFPEARPETPMESPAEPAEDTTLPKEQTGLLEEEHPLPPVIASEPEKLKIRQNSAILEFIPALIFMVTYNLAAGNRNTLKSWGGIWGEPIYLATAVFMAATLAALIYAVFVEKRLPILLTVVTVVVLTFGGLGIALHSDLFIKVKPTIINLLFATAIFGGLAFRRNVWRLLFAQAFSFPDAIWHVFAVRWGLFYLFLAGLNEVVWRNFSEAFWVNFKLLGIIPLTFVFILIHLPLTFKWLGKTNADYEAEKTGRDADSGLAAQPRPMRHEMDDEKRSV